MSILLSLVPLPVCLPPSRAEITVEQKYDPALEASENSQVGQKGLCSLDKRKSYDREASALQAVPTKNGRKKLFPISNYVRLISQQREGERRTFEIPVPEDTIPEPNPTPIDKIEVLEVIADRQEYDEQRQVISAEGNVVMRFDQAVLSSDRIQVNLADRIAVAEGNVILTRGEQILLGDRFEYYLVQDRGIITNARGQIDRSTLDRDLGRRLPQDPTITDRLLSDRLQANQPVTDVTLESELGVSIGNIRDYGILQGSTSSEPGTINRVRFEADKIEFEGKSWQAENLRLTNDPFSPPELEVRAKTAEFEYISPLVSKLTTTKSRLVFEDRLSLPLIRNSLVFDGRPRRPGLFNIGFDGEERGGLYLERTWDIIGRENINWTITPQYFLQRALSPTTFDFSREDQGGIFDSSVLGLKSDFKSVFSSRTDLRAKISITSFDVNELEDNIRAKLAATQLIGNINSPHQASLEYNFRERLFNGSLGFQTLYSSIGTVITSPNITLGKTGIGLKYQGSIQNINSETDDPELLSSDRDNNRTNLTRFQAAMFLGKSFPIWQGKPLPPTQDQGLRYTPRPVVPYLQFNTGISGVTSFYSNGDTQNSLRGTVGLQAQLGHFGRSFFDYTGFNATYSIGTNFDESPFLFDRDVDRQTLALGITQQLYGPIRLGVQTSFNLDDGDDISTDYVLQYSRRTYNVSLRYNPVLKIGSFSFQVNDFNWRGDPQPFESNDIRPVIQGVGR